MLLFQENLQLQTVAVGAGSGTFTGYAATTNPKIDVALGTGTFAGYAPTVVDSGNVNHTRSPAAATATFTGYAATTDPKIDVGAGAGTFTGYAATTNPKVDVGAGSGSFTGQAPVALSGDSQAISAGVGSGAFTGYEPSLLEVEPVPEGRANRFEQPAGGKRRKREELYHAEIDGQTFVGTFEEIQAVLARARTLAQKLAQKSAEQVVEDALRRARIVGKVDRVTVKAPRIKVDPELQAEADAIKAAYKDAQITAEIQALMAFEAEMDDEDVLLLL